MSALNLVDVLEKFWKAKEAGLHVYMIGRIESFDATTQIATVKPLIKDRTTGADGEVDVESVAVVRCPVVFPGGGGMRLTFPVAAGDYCEIHFADRPLGQWLAKGGEVDPIDVARHALKDCTARVGVKPTAAPWTGVDTSVVTLGSDAGTAQWVALANLVDARIAALVTAMNGHTHAVSTTGTALAQTGSAAASPSAVASQATVASATVKIKG